MLKGGRLKWGQARESYSRSGRPRVGEQSVNNSEPTRVYLAFLDVLGFGGLVLRDWEGARSTYERLIQATEEAAGGKHLNTSVQMISDSIIVKGPELWDVVQNTRFFLQGAVRSRCLIRGAIAAGKHLEYGSGENLQVISEALVRAVALEKVAEHPRVIIDLESVSEQDAWYATTPPGMSNVNRMILWKSGYWCVNPFSLVWFRSAVEIVAEMREQNLGTRHQPKYDWFLHFAQDVAVGAPMLPCCPLPGAKSDERLWIIQPGAWERNR
jgi:hypothetical protein